MKLYSTNNLQLSVSLKQAVLEGLPADNGLYMPERIPQLDAQVIKNIGDYSFPALAFEVAKTLLGDAIPTADLKKIIDQAVNFDAPIHSLAEDLHVLELFHGPTLAFKDFGARFMAQLMSYFNRDSSQPLYILVATSGDTGGAVASGFYQTPGIEVVILYPKGKVSHLQEKQLTTLGHNISALEIHGTFDDCQALVKRAFLDQELSGKIRLSSANSINIARLIPQSFYYFRAWQQLVDKTRPSVFCVPSGNLGNVTAGLMAKRMGLPIDRFIIASNANRVVPEYLHSGEYQPKPSVRTISNAMDVGNPSNFARLLDLYGSEWDSVKEHVAGYSYTDEETRVGIQEVFEKYNYVIDPHGAVGYLALRDYQAANPGSNGVVLETAHPSKFKDVVDPEIEGEVEVPARLAILADREKVALELSMDYAPFKAYLESRA